MTITNGVDADRLKSFIERIERLEEEKAAIAADIRDVYAELKGAGYDVKTTRAIVKLRKIEADDRREQEELLDLYKHALGMLADLPLGEAAIEREVSPVRKATRRMQAARSTTPHDPETGEIREPTVSLNGNGEMPLGRFMAIANALESPVGRAVAAGFIAGVKAGEQKNDETGEARAVDGEANAETSSSEASCDHEAGAPMHPQDAAPQPIRQPLRTVEPRVPEPAPEMPDLPAFLDRRNERAEQTEAAE